MRIIGGETPDSSSGHKMVKLQLEIDEHAHPEHASRQVFVNLNINHPNQQPREISRRQLSAICHAVDRVGAKDTDDLLGLTLRVKLGVQPAQVVEGKSYDAKNEAKAFKALDEKVEEAATETQAPAEKPVPATAAAAGKPAARKAGWKK
jgi:hypothetical protein